MAEYIEREALIEDIDAAMDNAGMGYVIGQTLKRYVKRQPAADVVEVVRCCDCVWYNNRMCYHPRFEEVCERPPTMLDFDYCRYGARMDGE